MAETFDLVIRAARVITGAAETACAIGVTAGRIAAVRPATFAEFEVDLLRMRTRAGMAVARGKGKLRGKQPKLSARRQRELARMAGTGEYTIADLAEVFTVTRATVSRTLQRSPAAGAAR